MLNQTEMSFFPKFYGYQVSVEDTIKINTNQIVENRIVEIPHRERETYKPIGERLLICV
jgi:hypothetical protein